jgi:predicted secreted protein
MSISLALAIYFICWWVVLFAVLPLRIGPQPPEGERDAMADAAGAPYAPNIGRKFIVTTVVSAAVFAVIYTIFAFQLVTLDNLPF